MIFKDLVESYKDLPLKDKKNEILKDIKTMIAIMSSEDENFDFDKFKNYEILDLEDGSENEDDYLEALFVYIQILKELAGNALLRKDNL